MAPVKSGSELGLMVPSLKLAEENGKKFLDKLGAHDLKAARALTAEAIQKGGVAMGLFWPAANGTVLLGDPFELYQAGQYNDTPVLIGSNSDEGALFVHQEVSPAEFEKNVREGFGSAAAALLQVYPHATDAQAFKSTKDLFRESMFAWHTKVWADLHSQKGKTPAYVYYFDRRTDQTPDGASHATEIGYVFGHLNGWGGGSGPEVEALANLMSSYWVNFAKVGDPNGPGLPSWPAFSATNRTAMIFDKAPGARPLPNQDKLQAFDSYYSWRREQAKGSQNVGKP